MPTDKKKASKGRKKVSPSRPKTPRRATSKGLSAPKNRQKNRAAKGAMKQSPIKKKKKY